MAGLTPQGFIPATAQEIRVVIANALKANLGGDIDTNPSSRIGQFIDILSTELESLWLGLEAVYDSQFPDSASGVSLDNIGSITNTPRKGGFAGQVELYFGGQIGSTVPKGTIVGHASGYELTTAWERPIAQNCWLTYTDLIPTSDMCEYDVIYNGVTCGTIEIYVQDTPTDIKTKLADASKATVKIKKLSRDGTYAYVTTYTDIPWTSGSDVTITAPEVGGLFDGDHTIWQVIGPRQFKYQDAATAINENTVDFTTAFVKGKDALLTPGEITVVGQFTISGGLYIKFNPTNPADVWGLNTDNTRNYMYSGSTPTEITLEQSVTQVIQATGNSFTDQTFEPHTIMEVISSVPGVTSVLNISKGIPASDRETDAEYRQRLKGELSASGTSSVTSIVSSIKALPGVSWVALVENPLSAPDAAGRPGHSFEVYVEGGDDTTIGQKIIDLHPPGVKIVSTATAGLKRIANVIDWNNQPAVVEFSQVQREDIIVEVTGTKNSSYPADGNSQVATAIANYINSLGIAEVFYSHKLYGIINTIPGIVTMVVKAAKKLGTPVENAVIDPGPLKHCYVDLSVAGNITITLT